MTKNTIPQVSDEDNAAWLENQRVVLMDVEGTLTYGKRALPNNPDQKDMREALNDKVFEGDQEAGYWSGLHLLAGEKPSEYFERVNNWKNGELSRQEFEEKNVEKFNELLKSSRFETPKELLNWYNESFLDLRDRSQELVELYQENGYKVGILSHTSTSLSKTAAIDLGADFIVPTWSFRFSEESFDFVEDEVYADEKAEIIDLLHQVKVEKICFVGNAENDVNIANKADQAYMVETEKDLDYTKIDAFSGDFDEVLGQVKTSLEVEN